MPLDGKYIGRYQLLQVIGRGSMGEVYLLSFRKKHFFESFNYLFCGHGSACQRV
jgi:hypothetical protein